LSTKNSLSASGHGRSGGSLVLSKIEYLGRLAGRENFEDGTGINFIPSYAVIPALSRNPEFL